MNGLLPFAIIHILTKRRGHQTVPAPLALQIRIVLMITRSEPLVARGKYGHRRANYRNDECGQRCLTNVVLTQGSAPLVFVCEWYSPAILDSLTQQLAIKGRAEGYGRVCGVVLNIIGVESCTRPKLSRYTLRGTGPRRIIQSTHLRCVPC